MVEAPRENQSESKPPIAFLLILNAASFTIANIIDSEDEFSAFVKKAAIIGGVVTSAYILLGSHVIPNNITIQDIVKLINRPDNRKE